MGKQLIPVAMAILWAFLSLNAAQSQDSAQNSPQPAAKTANQAPAPQQQTSADSSDLPTSLADMARAARAKKQTGAPPAAESSKVLDDDNMPRGVYAADIPHSKAGSSSGQASASPAAGGPFPEFRGKVILLDFWASWCGACHSALPDLKRLQAVYGTEDLVVISISEDDEEAAWRAFVASHGMTWPQRFDSDNSLKHEFGVKALPTYILIGRNGTVVQKLVGEAPAETIVERIGPDLKASLATKP